MVLLYHILTENGVKKQKKGTIPDAKCEIFTEFRVRARIVWR